MQSIPFLLVGALGVLGVLAFVLEPLFRDDEDLEPFTRARMGVQQVYGDAEVSAPESGGCTLEHRECPHCETEVPSFYDFCGSCVRPVGD